MNRRHALSLLAALPLAARLDAQTRSTPQHRVFLSDGHLHGLLLAPDGTLQSWFANEGAGRPLPAPDMLAWSA